jgi:hypothetical protein
LTADTNRGNNSTFVLGEDVAITFRATGLAPSTMTTLSVSVIDELDNEIDKTALAMSADSSGNATVSFAPPTSRYGYYRVNALLPDGNTIPQLGTRPKGFISYAIVADPAKRTNYGDTGSRFGMQGGFSPLQGSVIPYLGVRYILDSSGWTALEPSDPEQFSQSRSQANAEGKAYPPKNVATDAVIYNGAPWPTYGISALSRASVPHWALQSGTTGTLCKSMGALNSAGVSGLQSFAQALGAEVAKDYANQSAHYYQVTWEPENSWCFGGSPQQLVQFFELSYAALHAADPKAVVTGPTLFPVDTAALNKLWSAGLAKYVDAVSMHPYVQWPPETNGLVSQVRAQMKAANSAKGASVPFVGTEHGFTSGSFGELNGALGDIRSTIILLGEGFKFDFAFYVADFWEKNASEIGNTYGYYWNLDSKLPFGTDKLAPKPAVPAYSAMTYLLDGTTTGGPLSNLDGTQMGYRFLRGETSILVLWDYHASSSRVTLSVPNQSLQICDWMGNCKQTSIASGTLNVSVGAEPIYIIGKSL